MLSTRLASQQAALKLPPPYETQHAVTWNNNTIIKKYLESLNDSTFCLSNPVVQKNLKNLKQKSNCRNWNPPALGNKRQELKSKTSAKKVGNVSFKSISQFAIIKSISSRNKPKILSGLNEKKNGVQKFTRNFSNIQLMDTVKQTPTNVNPQLVEEMNDALFMNYMKQKYGGSFRVQQKLISITPTKKHRKKREYVRRRPLEKKINEPSKKHTIRTSIFAKDSEEEKKPEALYKKLVQQKYNIDTKQVVQKKIEDVKSMPVKYRNASFGTKDRINKSIPWTDERLRVEDLQKSQKKPFETVVQKSPNHPVKTNDAKKVTNINKYVSIEGRTSEAKLSEQNRHNRVLAWPIEKPMASQRKSESSLPRRYPLMISKSENRENKTDMGKIRFMKESQSNTNIEYRMNSGKVLFNKRAKNTIESSKFEPKSSFSTVARRVENPELSLRKYSLKMKEYPKQPIMGEKRVIDIVEQIKPKPKKERPGKSARTNKYPASFFKSKLSKRSSRK